MTDKHFLDELILTLLFSFDAIMLISSQCPILGEHVVAFFGTPKVSIAKA